MTDREVFRFAVDCASCQKALVLEYVTNGRYRLHRWTCPTCQKENRINMSGEIVTVRSK